MDAGRIPDDSLNQTGFAKMHKVDLRKHQRILVPGNHSIHVSNNGNGPAIEGTVTVIGLGGLFIRTRDSQPYGTVLYLVLKGSYLVFEAECTVRNVAPNGLGVEITSITPPNEQKLKELLLQLKS